MRKDMRKDYYGILNLRPGASKAEIEEAYRRAMAVYGTDSVAVYSLYTEGERAERVGDLNEAYETLTDQEKRAAYDGGLDLIPPREEETPEVDLESLRESLGLRSPAPETRKHLKYGVTRLKRPLEASDSDQMIAEQYRVLFTNLDQISHKDRSTVFAITSAIKGEGKSVTSLNLAYVMATEFKKRTVMVECDLRKPSTVADMLEPPCPQGLSDVLKGEAELHASILQVEDTGLFILPAGNITRKTSEILGSSRITGVINTLKAEFDYVLVDSPPVLPLVDMNVISRLVDGVIMVVRAGKTQRDIVQKAFKSLSKCNIAGVVLNGADTRLGKYYY